MLISALTSGCALPAEYRDSTRPSWSYTRNPLHPPIATYGVPNTAVQMAFACDPLEETVHIEFVDTEILEDRPIELLVEDVTYRGTERLDPPDGFAVSRISVPWNEAVLERYADGTGVMMVIAKDEKFLMPIGQLPRLMIRDCLSMRR